MANIKMVSVIATAQGFDGVRMREKDDEFEVPENVYKQPVFQLNDKGEFVIDRKSGAEEHGYKVVIGERVTSWLKLNEKPAAKPNKTPAKAPEAPAPESAVA